MSHMSTGHPLNWSASTLANVTLSNTNAETDMIALTVPHETGDGNGPRVGDLIHLTAQGQLAKNAGGTVRIRLYYGATTVLDSGNLTLADSGNPNQILIRGTLAFSAPNTQRLTLQITGNRQLNFGPVIAGFTSLLGFGTAAESTADPKVLRLTLQFSAASAANNCTIYQSYLRQ